jgi:hypothetical protein
MIPFYIPRHICNHIIKEVKDHWYKNITGFNKYNGKGKSNRSCLEKSIGIPSSETMKKSEEN